MYSLQTYLSKILVLLSLACGLFAADLHLDFKRDAYNLSGAWQVTAGHMQEDVWQTNIATAINDWVDVTVPTGSLMQHKDGFNKEQILACESVWARRSFRLSQEQAQRQGVLKWGGVSFGASVWINGKFLDKHVPIGPHTILIPHDVLIAGTNDIVLKIQGWNGIPKSKSGFPLLPVGAATQSWGSKAPGIYQDIWLEFYDEIYTKHIHARPQISKEYVAFHYTLQSHKNEAQQLRVAVEIRKPGDEYVIARASSTAVVEAGQVYTGKINCVLQNPDLWTPETPALYEARIVTSKHGDIFDDVRIHFGMREISIANGRFQLNGKPLWLRGSSLVNEWLWGNKYNESVKTYLVDEARAMNMNVMRTHTQPMPTLWADTADQHGMMFLAEMPLLYNHGEFGYSKQDYEILHRNALIDCEAWMRKLCNHPSIIMWVISNESHEDNHWESTVLYRHAKKIDPTLPIMRTGEELMGTPDVLDAHTCFSVVRYPEGQFQLDMADLMKRKDPQRPLCNSEYINNMWGPAGRALGDAKHPGAQLIHAEFGAEQTECMRRLGFDLLLPYMYAGWTGLRGNHWRDDFPTPMAAALHSSMSPILASVDLWDRNFVVGTQLDVPICLINETLEPEALTVKMYITPEDPVFVPDAQALEAAIWQKSNLMYFDSNSRRRVNVRIPIPQGEGTYYLAVVVTPKNARPIVSQRVVRAVNPGKYSQALKGKRIQLLGATDVVRTFLKRHQCEVREWVRDGKIDADILLIDDMKKINYMMRPGAIKMITDYAKSGRQVIVLRQETWPGGWKALIDCEVGKPEYQHINKVACSRAHIYREIEHSALNDYPLDLLWRWNGLPNKIADEVILENSAVMKNANKLLWASNKKFPVLMSIPMGKGEMIMCQLYMRERLNPGQKHYDPAAERFLINLLRQ